MAKKHAQKIKSLKGRHYTATNPQGTTGACLDRCEATAQNRGYTPKCSCSHRWQAHLKADESSASRAIYNWPAYKTLADKFQKTRETRGKSFPIWGVPYFRWQGEKYAIEPTPHAWDVGDWEKNPNFTDNAYSPYAHQSHHLIATSTLREAIEIAAEGVDSPDDGRALLRNGLLAVKYNAHGRQNMMILPMVRAVADTLELPLHQRSVDHPAYRTRTLIYVKEVLMILKDSMVARCEVTEADCTRCKQRLESYSARLWKSIVAAGAEGARYLEDMPAPYFRPSPAPARPLRS